MAAMPAQKMLAQPGAEVSLQVFYDDLSPYGQWVDDPDYGYCWIPSVGGDFRPYYSDGHWVMTEYGNMWVSDYPWGWAPFHYGRWTYNNYYGWVWIPDTEWAPAWVSWRSSPDYYGWAPLGPGVSVTLAFGGYNPPDDWWVFVPPVYIYDNDWHRHYEGHRYNTTIINQTTIINNTYVDNSRTYIAGPRPEEVRQATHKDVKVYNVRNYDKPGKAEIQNNEVKVYRPAVQKTAHVAPPPQARKPEHPIGNPQPIYKGDQAQPQHKQNVQGNQVEQKAPPQGQKPEGKQVEQKAPPQGQKPEGKQVEQKAPPQGQKPEGKQVEQKAPPQGQKPEGKQIEQQAPPKQNTEGKQQGNKQPNVKENKSTTNQQPKTSGEKQPTKHEIKQQQRQQKQQQQQQNPKK